MTHGYMSSSNIQNHFRNKERIVTRSAISFGKIHHLLLVSNQTANAACKYNSYSVYIDIVLINTSIEYGLVTSYYSCLSKPIQLAGFFSVQKICWFKPF